MKSWLLTWPPTLLQKILAGILAFFLLWAGGCFWIGQQKKEAALLATADEQARVAKEKDDKVTELLEQTKKLQEEAKAEREKNDADRQAWAEQQAALTRSILATNQAAERRRAEALRPKTQEEVAKDAKETLGISPPVQDGGFKLSVKELQEYVALKIEASRCAENEKRAQQQSELDKQTISTLRSDLDRAIKGIDDANQRTEDMRLSRDAWKEAAQSYKKVAKKGFWRKTADVGGKVGLAFGAALIARKI